MVILVIAKKKENIDNKGIHVCSHESGKKLGWEWSLCSCITACYKTQDRIWICIEFLGWV